MYSSTLLTAFLALGLATAVPYPPRALKTRQAPPPSAQDAKCAQAVILAQGIALNIADQQQELATVNAMSALLQAQPVNADAWTQSRANLLQFINNGIAIRQMNQLITPQQSPSTAGVAVVANAQLTELGLANSLSANANDDVAGNLKTVQTLQMDFSGGIVQNQKNMADSLAGCGSVGAAGAAGAPPAAMPPMPAQSGAPAPAGMPAPAEPPAPMGMPMAAPEADPNAGMMGGEESSDVANFASRMKIGVTNGGFARS